MITKRIRNTIIENNLIEKDGHIVLGLSGGPDSVCLFHVLKSLSKEMHFTLHVVHINHKFRPGAAEEDQAYVEKLCRSHGIDCRVFTFDCPVIAAELGITGEEAGRKVRYEAFFKTAIELMYRQKLSKVKIAVAHNMNDQAETLFIRILRGTGTDGLAGMEYKRAVQYDELVPVISSMNSENIPEHLANTASERAANPESFDKHISTGIELIRPLLDIERADIESYCTANELNPRIDFTNLEPVYTRNKIRLDLIPYINEKFGGDISERLNRLARIAGEDKEYLWWQAREAREKAKLPVSPGAYGTNENIQVYAAQALREMHPSIRHRVILDIFSEMGLVQDISNAHIMAADKILIGGQTGKIAEFPQGFRLTISYGAAVFSGELCVERNASPELSDKEKGTAQSGSKNSASGNERETAIKTRTCLKASLLTRGEWERQKTAEPERYNRANLGMLFAVFDYNTLCNEFNISDRLPDNWADMTGAQRSIFLQRKLSILKRLRREGDFLMLTPLGGTKKIQDYFVDAKVPRELRQNIQLAARGSEVLWVIDDELQRDFRWGRTSGKYKLLDVTERILLLELVPIL